jgi:hypothetical protein
MTINEPFGGPISKSATTRNKPASVGGLDHSSRFSFRLPQCGSLLGRNAMTRDTLYLVIALAWSAAIAAAFLYLLLAY